MNNQGEPTSNVITDEQKKIMKIYEKGPDVERPKAKTFVPTPGECCCKRPETFVVCIFCGFTQPGRVKVTCPRHPLSSYKHDLEVCPGCKSPLNLVEKNIDLN